MYDYKNREPEKGRVIQFNERHKWCGALGVIKEKRGDVFTIGIPVINSDRVATAYIKARLEEFEVIGIAAFVEVDDAKN